MTDTNETNRRPTHIIFQVIGDGDNAHRHRIGVGWSNHDGTSISLKLDDLLAIGQIEVGNFFKGQTVEDDAQGSD